MEYQTPRATREWNTWNTFLYKIINNKYKYIYVYIKKEVRKGVPSVPNYWGSKAQVVH